eukprot:1797923-Pyramimonas_sp.AAC.1
MGPLPRGQPGLKAGVANRRSDVDFDSIEDLATWIPAAPTHAGDDSVKGLGDAIKKAKTSMEKSYAERIAAPLDPLFSGDKLSEALADGMQKLVDDPTLAIILYT